MRAEEGGDISVELVVKGNAIEVRRIIGADARNGGRKLRRAWCQECKMASRQGVNVRCARKAVCNPSIAGTVSYAWSSAFGSPILQRDFDRGQIILRECSIGWIDNDRGFYPCIMRRVGRSFSVVKLLAISGLLLAKLCNPPEIRGDSNQHQAGITSV